MDDILQYSPCLLMLSLWLGLPRSGCSTGLACGAAAAPRASGQSAFPRTACASVSPSIHISQALMYLIAPVWFALAFPHCSVILLIPQPEEDGARKGQMAWTTLSGEVLSGSSCSTGLQEPLSVSQHACWIGIRSELQTENLVSLGLRDGM